MDKRITVDVSEDTYRYLDDIKNHRGISISFQANSLIEQAIKERNRPSRKRKSKSNERPPVDNT